MGTLSAEQKTYTATTKQGKYNNNKQLVTKSSNVKSNLFARKGRRWTMAASFQAYPHSEDWRNLISN